MEYKECSHKPHISEYSRNIVPKDEIIEWLETDAKIWKARKSIKETDEVNKILRSSAPRLSKTNFKSAVISYTIFYREYQDALWLNNP